MTMTFDDVLTLMKRIANVPPDLLEGVDTEDKCAAWLVDKVMQVQHHYIPRFMSMLNELQSCLEVLDQHLTEQPHDPNSICWMKRAVCLSAIKQTADRLEAAESLQFAVIAYLSKTEGN